MQPDTPFSAKVHEFFKPRRSAAGVSPTPAAHATAPRTARAEAPKRRRRDQAAERAPSPQSPVYGECTVEDLEAALRRGDEARPPAAAPVHVDDGSKAQGCAVDRVDDTDTDVGRCLKECLAQEVSENDTSPLDKLLRQARQDAEQPASAEAVGEAVRKAALTGEFGLRDKIGQNFAR